MNKEENITLQEWLKHQKQVRWKNPLLCTLRYKNIQCAGIITKSNIGDSIQIRPIQSTDDIGFGSGMMEVKHFIP